MEDLSLGGLKPKEEVFCKKFCETYSQRQAAIAAGYGVNTKTGKINVKSASVAACRLMQRQEIKDRIHDIMTNAANEAGATPLYITKQLKTIVDRCLNDVKPVKKWDVAKGRWVETGEFVFNTSGANRALATLADIQGLKSMTNRLVDDEGKAIEFSITVVKHEN